MQAIDRTARILTALATCPDGMGVSELAREVGEAPSTVHRLLTALTQHDLAIQEADRRYRLGVAVLRLAQAFQRQDRLVTVASPFLHALSERTQESLFLSELIGDDVVCVASAESPRPLTYYMRPGGRLPYHASSSARAIIAFRPQELATRLVAQETLIAFTERTPTTAVGALREIERTYDRGYAICDDEMEVGVLALSVPVCNDHEALASITIVAPTHRLEPKVRADIVCLLEEAASAIETSLGHRGVEHLLRLRTQRRPMDLRQVG